MITEIDEKMLNALVGKNRHVGDIVDTIAEICHERGLYAKQKKDGKSAELWWDTASCLRRCAAELESIEQ